MLSGVHRNHRSRALAALVLLPLAGPAVALGAGAAQAQPGGEVSLYVTVVQGDKLIGGLRQENFRLYEDGQTRDFRTLTFTLAISNPRSSVL